MSNTENSFVTEIKRQEAALQLLTQAALQLMNYLKLQEKVLRHQTNSVTPQTELRAEVTTVRYHPAAVLITHQELFRSFI